MGQHDAGAAVADGVSDDCPQRELGGAFISAVIAEMQAARLFIDVGDKQPLCCRVGALEAAGKECRRGALAVEPEGKFGTLIAHGRNLRFGIVDWP